MNYNKATEKQSIVQLQINFHVYVYERYQYFMEFNVKYNEVLIKLKAKINEYRNRMLDIPKNKL